MKNELNIGMSFSGGGYRAATFDLGTLSFLNSIQLDDGRTLLDCVSALSSVSGGTITAMKYMLARARGQRVDDMVNELFDFLCNEDLMTHALQRLSDEKANREASSIKIMAGIYDQLLFDHATMGDIIDHFDRIPVKDYTALSTDFDNSLPFRFRLTEGQMSDGERMTYGVFGNQKHSIGRSVVRHITPGEALACSSCFPSGFEPMMYPDDFQVSQLEDIAHDIKSRFGLMDGALSDNQGIDPILLAEERMRKYRIDKTRTDKALDLIIVSDVASPYMDGYSPCDQAMPNGVGKLTLGRLRNYGLISEAVVMVLFIVALVLGSNFWLGVMSVILAIVTLANIVGALLKSKMFAAIRKTFVGDRAAFISHLKFASIEAMVMNRAKSVVMMSSEVFLKRLRQMSYSTIYDNQDWHNRAVTSTIYELRQGERWESMSKNGTMPGYLVPSLAIQQNSARAASMGTTLWFTAEDKAAGMPQALLAAGQYNMCYNLLDYIEKIEADPTNLTGAHRSMVACKPQLLAAWQRFQQDPHWMVPDVTRR
ncbi:MAG: patatin-like phospholipase family protein [Muribaculaceae bacterium]|nr:patatin-like phospholipase family protein [Muribaculaceae bacterium]